MIRPMIRPMIKSMVNPGGGDSAITRFFAQLDDVLMSHYAFVNTRVFANGDSFKGEFTAPAATVVSNERITDGDNTVNPALFELDSDGTYNIGANMSVTVDGIAITGATSYPTDNKLHEYILSFTGAARLKYLAKNEASSTNFFNGIQANPSTTISGLTESWTLGLSTGNSEVGSNGEIINYVNIPDSNRELFTLIEGSWFGVELWVYGGYTYTGLETINDVLIGVTASADIIAGNNYSWSFNYLAVGVGETRLRVGGTVSSPTSTGLFAGSAVAINDDLFFQVRTDPSLMAGTTITSPSVMRLIEIA